MPTVKTFPGAALELHGISCGRGERTLFTGLDLRAESGAIVWLRGANGQGKTTLLRTIAGLSAPAAGRIVLPSHAVAWPLLYLGHANGLKDDLTAAESLRFLLRLDAGSDPLAASVDAALARFGMAERHHAPVRTLSQGQRRRVALARLAAADAPALWLLDEPYDALDAEGAAVLNGVLAGHAQRGGIVVLTSHLPLLRVEPRPVEVHLGAPVDARAGDAT